MDKMADVLGRVGAWCGQNKYLSAIKNTFQNFMPLTIAGAIGVLWCNVLVNADTGLGMFFKPIMILDFLNPAFQAINFCTISCITVGMGYNCVISACPLWMPEKTATATGLLLMGYALSTAVFGPMISSIIENHGIVIAFRMVAMVCGCGLFLLEFYVGDPNLKEIDLLPQRNRHEGKQDYNVIIADMVKMPMFWIYYLIIVILPGIGLCILNHNAPMMTETIGVSTALAATVVSLVSFCNGFA